MRIAIALASLLMLSACADGRWVANDLSSFSFKFNATAPAGPFSKPRAASAPRATATSARAPRRTMAASSY